MVLIFELSAALPARKVRYADSAYTQQRQLPGSLGGATAVHTTIKAATAKPGSSQDCCSTQCHYYLNRWANGWTKFISRSTGPQMIPGATGQLLGKYFWPVKDHFNRLSNRRYKKYDRYWGIKLPPACHAQTGQRRGLGPDAPDTEFL